LKPATLAKLIAQLTLTKKGADVLIINLRGLSSVADFFVVCSADSEIQVKAIADAVEDGTIKKGARPWHREVGSPNWVVLDYVDVVLHVFHKTTRSFYNLERLWGDAETTHIEDSPRRVARRKTATKKTSASRSVSRRKVAS
jgi:ribosome-associated protein